ncbi:MAG: TonB-dependent receptor [Acidobacteria bacterium]|nr:TonB-dependent receptor [Acidobacteriota bacterium]
MPHAAIFRGIARFLLCILFFVLFPSLPKAETDAGAETFSIKGRIISTDTMKSVPGVTVRLVGTTDRTATDAEGCFVFSNLNPGGYTLVTSHLQYIEQRIVLNIPPAPDLLIEVDPRPHETIIVTAAPWAVDRADVAQSANVVDTTEVKAHSGMSVGDAVSSLPGVRSIATGESGGTPMIRGQTNERIRILSNGFPHDYYQFSRRHMPNIETFDSHSIEVIRGPASVLYGTQAMGGLANLVSAPLPNAPGEDYIFHGEGILGYAGNNEARIGHGQIEGAKGGLGARAAWTRRISSNTGTPEGSLPNTDYDQRSSLLEMGYGVTGGIRLRGQYRYWENDLGFYIPPQPDFRLNLRNDIGEIEFFVPSEWGEWSFSSNISRNNRRAFPEGRSQGAKVDLRLLTQTYRASLEHKPVGMLRGWLQLEYTRQNNKSFGPVTLLPYYRNRTWSAAIFEEVRLVRSGELDRLVLNLGFRYDNRHLEVPANPERGIDEDFSKSYTPVTGSVGAVFRFNQAFSVGLSYSRGWRNPSEYELFAEGPHDGTLLYERGNPSLHEETNRNLEFTLRMEEKRVRGFFALYRNSYDDYIYQRLIGEIIEELPVGVFSQADATMKGFEGQLSVDTTSWLTLSITGDALRSKNHATGMHLPFSPPDRAILGAHFHRASSTDWIHPYVEIRGTLTGKGKISGIDEPFPLDTGGYALLDLGTGIQRRFDKGILAFDLWISNVANRAYKDFLDTYKLYALSPGRNIRATLKFLF